MKNYRLVLIIFLILVVTTPFVVIKSITSLKEQNNALSANIDRLTRRITVLELDKTMEQITVLKAKNLALKEEIEGLKKELNKISKSITQQPSKPATHDTKQQKAALGNNNKGFLIKNSKPAR